MEKNSSAERLKNYFNFLFQYFPLGHLKSRLISSLLISKNKCPSPTAPRPRRLLACKCPTCLTLIQGSTRVSIMKVFYDINYSFILKICRVTLKYRSTELLWYFFIIIIKVANYPIRNYPTRTKKRWKKWRQRKTARPADTPKTSTIRTRASSSGPRELSTALANAPRLFFNFI